MNIKLGKSLQHAADMVDIQEYPVQDKLHMAIQAIRWRK